MGGIGVWNDGRFALRTLWKNRIFAAAAILTFALGIGATTAIFTVLYGVLLRPLPYREPDRIVFIATGTVPRFEEMKAAAQSYTELGAYPGQPGNAALSGEGEPEVLRLASVSANYLSILGVEPLVGRSFTPEEELRDGPPVAMISANLWRRRFGGDPSIAGRSVILSGGPSTIIGVLPDGFQFPFPNMDLWVTKPTLGMLPATPNLNIFGRLKPGVSIELASAELAVLSQQYAVAHPGMLDAKRASGRNTASVVIPLKDRIIGNVGSMLWMLFGAVGIVLLIACANVANLLLARSHSRSREFAVRAAIGAGRPRIIQQLLVETVVLACAGGAFGVLFGNFALRAITGMTAFNLPRTANIQLDSVVLGFTMAVSVVTGFLFGLIPALGVSRTDLSTALKSGAAVTGGRSSRTRAALVTVQVALSMILVIGATLLMQTMLRLYAVDLHFNPENVLSVQMSLSPLRYDTNRKRVRFADEMLERVKSQPGIRSVGIAWTLPFMGWPGTPVQVFDRALMPLNERPIAAINSVDAGYFHTLQIPLRRGRLFDERDGLDTAPVAIINETFARQFWPAYPGGDDPIGQRVLIGANTTPVTIVGIVGDIFLNPSVDIQRSVYRPYRQAPPPGVAFAIRTEGNPMRVANSVREQLRLIDRDQPIIAMRPLEEILDTALGQRRLVMTLLQLFAGLALILAMVGVYGVVAHIVTQRTREIGVLLALGARTTDIVRVLIGQAFWITTLGIAIGFAGAFGLTRFLKAYLFEVTPTDITTFIAVALGFLIVASASSYLPLRRATRIDPMTVLRHE